MSKYCLSTVAIFGFLLALSLFVIAKPLASFADTGGPDAFGYTFIDNNEPGGPVFNFIDISGSGTFVGEGDDNGFFPLPLGFDFNFYGTIYNEIGMSTNGFLGFIDQGLSFNGNECPLPVFDPQGPEAIIAALWDDLEVDEPNSGLFRQTFSSCPNTNGGSGSCTVFMWDNAAHFPNGEFGPFFDLEVILYDNGNILMQYPPGNAEEGAGSTTGLENETATIGINYFCDTAGSITPDLAVCFIHPDSPKRDCSPFVPVVPTLSQWGLIALAVLIGIAGLLIINRRKITA